MLNPIAAPPFRTELRCTAERFEIAEVNLELLPESLSRIEASVSNIHATTKSSKYLLQDLQRQLDRTSFRINRLELSMAEGFCKIYVKIAESEARVRTD